MLSNTIHSTGTCILEEVKPYCIWFRLSSIKPKNITGNNNNCPSLFKETSVHTGISYRNLHTVYPEIGQVPFW